MRQPKSVQVRILLEITSFMIWYNLSENAHFFPEFTLIECLYSLQTVGVIFKTERDFFRVLDQNGQVRRVQPHQISMRRDSNRAIATDAENHELRINDNVKEVDGEVCLNLLIEHTGQLKIQFHYFTRVGRVSSSTFTDRSLLSYTIGRFKKMEACSLLVLVH